MRAKAGHTCFAPSQCVGLRLLCIALSARCANAGATAETTSMPARTALAAPVAVTAPWPIRTLSLKRSMRRSASRVRHQRHASDTSLTRRTDRHGDRERQHSPCCWQSSNGKHRPRRRMHGCLVAGIAWPARSRRGDCMLFDAPCTMHVAVNESDLTQQCVKPPLHAVTELTLQLHSCSGAHGDVLPRPVPGGVGAGSHGHRRAGGQFPAWHQGAPY